jgi:hypothetical protein
MHLTRRWVYSGAYDEAVLFDTLGEIKTFVD